MSKNFTKYSKLGFYFIIIIPAIMYIAGCANNGNNSFTILEDAKTFLQDLTKSPEDFSKNKKNKEKQKNSDKKDKQTEKKLTDNAQEEKVLTSRKEKKTIKLNKKDKSTYKNTDLALNKEEPVESRIIGNTKYKVPEALKNQKKLAKENDTKKFFDIEKNKKVGVMLPLTGEKKNIGENILNALELALFQDKDSRIELVIKDTVADPKTTFEIFNELLDQGIDTFVGPLFSSSLLAIEEFALSKNINLFALTNNVNLAKKGVHVFGIYPHEQAETIVKFSLQQGANKTALLLPNNPYGYLLLETIKDTLMDFDKELIRVEFFDDNIDSQVSAAKKISAGFDIYEKQFKTLKENQLENQLPFDTEELDSQINMDIPFDTIFIGASGQSLTILASQLQYNSVDKAKVSFIGLSSWEDTTILREPALDGGFFATTSDKYKAKIKKIYKKTFKKEMNNISMIAYDIVALLNTVTKENNTLNTALLFNKEGYIGLRGLFRITEIGRVERVFQIKKITNKKFVTVKSEPKAFY